MTGLVIGKLTVQYRAKNNKYNQAVWHCRCECGNEKDILGTSLRNGVVYSCGKCNRKSVNTWDLSNDYGIGYDNKGNKFYFSKQDFDLIKNYYWRVHKHKYVSTNIWNTETKIKQTQLLHRFLLHPNKNQEVDHINHNPSDNRRENLRIVSTAQNQMNTVINKNNTSGIKGVNWDKDCNKWRVRISVNGERLSLGHYNTLEEATQARHDAELKYYGEYRYIKATQEE